MKKIIAISLAIFFLSATFIIAEGLIFSKVENVSESKRQEETILQNEAGSIPLIQTESGQNKASSITLSLAEVSKHNTESDCWLVIRDKVYNVSSFVGSHPGGVKKIVSNCGNEVTGLFASIHSNFAWDLLKKYHIGDLNSQISPQDKKISPQFQVNAETSSANNKIIKPTKDFRENDEEDD